MQSLPSETQEIFLIASECPRGAEEDVPADWEWRYIVAASSRIGGFKLWTDGDGHWLRVDSEPID